MSPPGPTLRATKSDFSRIVDVTSEALLMSLLVVGTIAYDGIETPAGKVVDEIGGSATYFALSASRFADVRLSGVVGDDFPIAKLKTLFDGRRVDFAGV